MKRSSFLLIAALGAAPSIALAQGTPGTTGGAAGSIGGTQAGTTTAPGGSNGAASTPAPAGAPGTNGSLAAPEASRSAPGGTMVPAGRSR